MKLYAIRRKDSRHLAYFDPDLGRYAISSHAGLVWVEKENAEELVAPLSQRLQEDMELVTLRVEPSEPCWHCKGANRQDPDNVWRDKFCRKCGRSLE